MKTENLSLEGLKLITLDSYCDSRGYFYEQHNLEKFSSMGLGHRFCQDNISKSIPNVIRGLHFQVDKAQGKLVGVVSGRIWDVAVDLRESSPSYGQHFSVTLDSEASQLFWIPPGFAHGFCVLGNTPAYVLYKVTEYYNPKGDRGILWNDPDLGIKWPIESPILSEKDKGLMSFKDYQKTNKN